MSPGDLPGEHFTAVPHKLHVYQLEIMSATCRWYCSYVFDRHACTSQNDIIVENSATSLVYRLLDYLQIDTITKKMGGAGGEGEEQDG